MVEVQNYECLCLEEALELCEVTIGQVAASLSLPRTSARLILENHGWNVDEVISDVDEYGKKIVLADCGIPFKKSRNLSPRSSTMCASDLDGNEYVEMEKCMGCAKTAMEIELVRLECEHLFCVSCWKSHIEAKSSDPSATLQSFFPIRCPVSKCGFLLDETKMEFIIDPLLMYSYKMRLLERFIITNRLLRLCPNRTCVVQTFEKREEKVEQCSSVVCKCGIHFCFACASNANPNCSVRVVTITSPQDPVKETKKKTKNGPSLKISGSETSLPLSKIPKMRILQNLKESFHSHPIPRRANQMFPERDAEKADQEKKILTPFYELINQASDKVCYGIEDTIFAIESGAAKTAFLWKSLPAKICVQSSNDHPLVNVHEDIEDYITTDNTSQLKYVRVTEWMKRNCPNYGTSLELIDGKSEEGSKFCSGFGIGATLRYSLDSLPSRREENGLCFNQLNTNTTAPQIVSV